MLLRLIVSGVVSFVIGYVVVKKVEENRALRDYAESGISEIEYYLEEL